MGIIIRLLMVAGAALATLVVARDAANFTVIEGMASLVIVAALVGALAFLLERR